MGTKTNTRSWLFRISIAAAVIGGVGTVAGGSEARLAAMSSSEISTLHVALFSASVWIVSSLRITRLKALWRVGLRLLALRGPSGTCCREDRRPAPLRGAPWAARALREFPEATRDILIFEELASWGIATMKTNFAASVLSALLYAQGLLGFAALATVLLKERAHANEFVVSSVMPSGPSLLVVR